MEKNGEEILRFNKIKKSFSKINVTGFICVSCNYEIKKFAFCKSISGEMAKNLLQLENLEMKP